MVGKRAQLILRNPPKRLRILAVLLLASLAWGTTVEFTHHHSARSSSAVSQSIFKSAQTSNAANEASSIRFESNRTNGSSSPSKTGAECLICQLHQNLSTTVFTHPPGVGPTETHVISPRTSVLLQLSVFTANQHGRAPPVNL